MAHGEYQKLGSALQMRKLKVTEQDEYTDPNQEVVIVVGLITARGEPGSLYQGGSDLMGVVGRHREGTVIMRRRC